ncbi:flavin reductase family protein [bacterium]|nr:flavin reductase family protein [bacterium]
MKKEIPLKQFHRVINHGSVILVTSQIEEGVPNIMAVAWNMPLSLIPPLVGISIAKSHFSHQLILQRGEFVLNVPSPSIVSKVMVCGKISGREENKFEKAKLTPVASEKVLPPLIQECIGHLECRVEQKIEVGDHTLFIGNVLKAWAEESLFDGVWQVDREGAEGLHHLGGDYFAISREKISASVG